MINGKTVLALIPARGGSKGLPGKNIRMLCGKPLIAWSIEKARKSRYVDTVVVSTDSPEIATLSKKFGAEVPFQRPADLADDHAPTFGAVKHVLDYYRDVDHREFSYTVLLEPTSPLREDDDVDRMLELLDGHEKEFDSIVSIGQVSEHPSIMKRLRGERMEPYCSELSQTTRRQDTAPAYFPYGVAYIAKTISLLNEKTFYTRNCMSFLIRRYQNYEIDDIYDFICIENIMKHEWGLK